MEECRLRDLPQAENPASQDSFLPLPAVFSGRNPFDLFKHTGKIVGILHAALDADFFNRKICKAQQLFGVSNAQGQKVSVDGDAELFPENPGQVKFVDIKSFRKVVEPDCFRIMEIQVILDLLQVIFAGGRFGGAPGMPAVLHQQRKQGSELLKNLHIADIIGGSRRFTEAVKNFLIRGKALGAKAGKTAALGIFFIDSGHVRTIKVRPFKCPELIGAAVEVALFTVQKHTVPGRECVVLLVVFEGTGAFQDNKTQVGGEIFPVAGVRGQCF